MGKQGGRGRKAETETGGQGGREAAGRAGIREGGQAMTSTTANGGYVLACGCWVHSRAGNQVARAGFARPHSPPVRHVHEVEELYLTPLQQRRPTCTAPRTSRVRISTRRHTQSQTGYQHTTSADIRRNEGKQVRQQGIFNSN